MTKQPKKPRRSAHQTQWAAQFAVASELCKRGYEIALTMGNHPMIDLIVISPKGVPFVIDVKGQYRKNPWPVRPKEPRAKLFYVFAFVPDNESNEFFILTQGQVNRAIQANWKRAIARRRAKGLVRRADNRFPVVERDFAARYKNRWDALPK
jgi:hypothetical protein